MHRLWSDSAWPHESTDVNAQIVIGSVKPPGLGRIVSTLNTSVNEIALSIHIQHLWGWKYVHNRVWLFQTSKVLKSKQTQWRSFTDGYHLLLAIFFYLFCLLFVVCGCFWTRANEKKMWCELDTSIESQSDHSVDTGDILIPGVNVIWLNDIRSYLGTIWIRDAF